MNDIKQIEVNGVGNSPVAEQAYIDYAITQLKQLGINPHNAHFVTVKHLSNSNISPEIDEVLKGIECSYVSAYEYVTKGNKHLHHWHLITDRHINLKGVHSEAVRELNKAVSYLCKQAVIWANSLYYRQMEAVIEPPQQQTVEVNSNDRRAKPQNPMNQLITKLYGLFNRPIIRSNKLFISKLTRNKPTTVMKGIDLNQQINNGYKAAKEGKALKGDESAFYIHGYQIAQKERVKPEHN